MKRLSRFSHNASVAWHGGLTRTDTESIFRVCGAVIQWDGTAIINDCMPTVDRALCVCRSARPS
eukprot:2881268-Prymnesium_polylepis.1